MLVTTCKHCGARFRVTPEQLNLRQGQVRCGQCHEVFNGFEALERFPGDDTGARLLAVAGGEGTRARSRRRTRRRRPRPARAAGQRPSPEPAIASRPRNPPAARRLADIPDLPDVPDLLLESAGSPRKRPRRGAPASRRAPPTARAEPFVPDAAARPSRAWAFGVVFLALVLALQLAYAFRAHLAQQYPVLRPILESACANVGLHRAVGERRVGTQARGFGAARGSRQARPDRAAGTHPQPLADRRRSFPTSSSRSPTLTGQTAVRRVLRPADYLGRAAAAGEVMAPESEALLQRAPRDQPHPAHGLRAAALLSLSAPQAARSRRFASIESTARSTSGASSTIRASPRRICSRERLGRHRDGRARVGVREEVDALGGADPREPRAQRRRALAAEFHPGVALHVGPDPGAREDVAHLRLAARGAQPDLLDAGCRPPGPSRARATARAQRARRRGVLRTRLPGAPSP